MRFRRPKGWLDPALALGGVLLTHLTPVLAASDRMDRVTAQTRLLLGLAAVFSVFIFFLVLFRKKLTTEDKIDINWAAEEDRLRQLAELTLKARGAELPTKPIPGATPVATVAPGPLSPAMAALEGRPTETAPDGAPAPVDSEMGRIMRGLSD